MSKSNIREMDGVHYSRELILDVKKEVFKRKRRTDKYKKIDEIFDYFEDISLDTIEKYTESPIEKQTAFALYLTGKMYGLSVNFIPPSFFEKLFLNEIEKDSIEDGIYGFYRAADLLVIPNMPIVAENNKYRLDFLISAKPKGKRKKKLTIVECDSFQYHSTASQLEKEKKRERALMKFEGANILRFSGREIFRNPTEVAVEIIDSCLGTEYGKK